VPISTKIFPVPVIIEEFCKFKTTQVFVRSRVVHESVITFASKLISETVRFSHSKLPDLVIPYLFITSCNAFFAFTFPQVTILSCIPKSSREENKISFTSE